MTGRAWITPLVAGLVLAVAGSAAAEEGMLDGKTFAVELVEVGAEEGDADSLAFAMGTFRSSACDTYGFTAAPYTAMEKDGAVHFEAETTSPTEGRMHWKAVVTNDAIEGTAVWYKDDEKKAEYRFTGTLAE